VIVGKSVGKRKAGKRDGGGCLARPQTYEKRMEIFAPPEPPGNMSAVVASDDRAPMAEPASAEKAEI
jgi:hypothetical protein